MEIVLPIAILLSLFLALNIGANNSAASMATAYGAGARTKKQSLMLIAVFALLGAVIAGAPVVKTLGIGLVSSEVLSSHVVLVLIVLVIAIIFVLWANVIRIPIATTHAVVCAIAGVGIYTSSLNGKKFTEILIWWITAPIVAWVINYLLAKHFYFKTLHYLAANYNEKTINRILTVMITVSGSFLAFSAGANNSANAVGPIVGLGLIDPYVGSVLAGVAMGIGAILLGGRVLDTVGKEITEICILRAASVEFTGAGMILLASVYGIPVSIAEIVTSGIIGFSCAQQGFGVTARNRHVVRIAFFWFFIPIFAVAASYLLSSIYFSHDVAAMIGY